MAKALFLCTLKNTLLGHFITHYTISLQSSSLVWVIQEPRCSHVEEAFLHDFLHTFVFLHRRSPFQGPCEGLRYGCTRVSSRCPLALCFEMFWIILILVFLVHPHSCIPYVVRPYWFYDLLIKDKLTMCWQSWVSSRSQ